MTLDRLWWVLAVALPAMVALLVPIPAVDLAYQLRAGGEILQTGAVPAVDTWTFTAAGVPWTDQQWLAQVLLALVHRVGGWELLAVLRAVLVSGSMGLLAVTAVARGARPRTAALLALAAFALASPAMALRPQLLAIGLFAGLLALLAFRHRHPRLAWLAPLLVLAWANIHGSFVLAPVLLGWAWLDDLVRGRPARGSLAMLVVVMAATLVTPFGAGAWVYAAGIGTNPVIAAQATEWQRTSPLTPTGLLFYISVVAGFGLALRGRVALRWPDALLLLGLALLGAWTQRGVAWWPFGLVFLVGGLPDVLLARVRSSGRPATAMLGPEERGSRPLFGQTPEGRARRASRVPGAMVALAAVLVVALLPWWRPADPLIGRADLVSYAPSGLALALRELDVAGVNVLIAQTWTSFFEWAVPEARYFLDSRFELFPAEVWADREIIAAGGPGAQAVLDRRGVDVLVLPAGLDLQLDGWSVVFEDADGAILRRVPPVGEGG